MKDDELERVLAGLDSALAVFRRNEGKLDVADIRIQSILSTLRHELALYRAVARTAERTNKESQ
jgi:hypothetical protein